MIRGWRLRPPSGRLGPLVLSWLFQGTRLLLLLGIPVLIVGVILLALALLALAVWPVVLLAGCATVAAWALRTRRPAVSAPVIRPGAVQVARLSDALPPSARERVDRVTRKAQALVGRAGGSGDEYLVQRTLDDYLPASVDAYLSLPPGSADWPV